ncbi:MAG: class I SAM-dependent methyltransferase [Bacteroidia bacterium]|nr:class I SAM-dependent methyltransferase [Bacteroidia bacterium]
MNKNYKTITSCRVCNSDNIIDVLDLGMQHIQGAFKITGHPDPCTNKFPNKIIRCLNCHLVQSAITVDPKLLYSNYWYQSSISNTMRNHLAWVADTACRTVDVPFARVLDIACNDGCLLKAFPLFYEKTGVDPSNVAKNINDSDITVYNTLFPCEALKSKQFDIVTSIAVFYDLDNPVQFAQDIGNILTDDGVWFLEVAYLPYILENLCYDTMVFEHIEHYSLLALDFIFNKVGFRIFRAEKTPTNGGSIFIGLCHKNNFKFDRIGWSKHWESLKKKEEQNLKLHTEEPYIRFATRVQDHRNELVTLIDDIIAKGKTIHLYGASTKVNTILEYCELNKYIQYAAERSQAKFGGQTLNGINIISEAESRAMKPDYYLVAPYHFRREILQREHEIRSQGTKFIFPLPKIEIV